MTCVVAVVEAVVVVVDDTCWVQGVLAGRAGISGLCSETRHLAVTILAKQIKKQLCAKF